MSNKYDSVNECTQEISESIKLHTLGVWQKMPTEFIRQLANKRTEKTDNPPYQLLATRDGNWTKVFKLWDWLNKTGHEPSVMGMIRSCTCNTPTFSISVTRVLEIYKMNIVTAITFDVCQRRTETRTVVGARVKNMKAGIFQFDQRPHHERQSVECWPCTDVVRQVMNVHLRCVDLQRHLANAVDESRSYKVVQRGPLRELDVHFDKIQRSLLYTTAQAHSLCIKT